MHDLRSGARLHQALRRLNINCVSNFWYSHTPNLILNIKDHMPQQTPSLDHSRGRAFISDGVIYYSPNCSRSVAVPNRNTSYPFAVGAASLRRHQNPEWWTDAYGFLSFIPNIPSFEGYAFGHLRDYLNNIEEVDAPWGTGYQLEQSKCSAWRYLEDVLIIILHLLKEKFILRLKPYFLPHSPSRLGFDQVFFSARGARYRIGRARDWFIVWIGLLSFYIACIEGAPNPLQVPDWFNFLASEKEVDQLWLSGLYDVVMSAFWKRTRRTGSFVDLTNERGEGTSIAKWLCVWDVPVWYRWSAVEQGQSWRDAFRYFQPPPEHLQNATTIIYRSPSPLSPPPAAWEGQLPSSPNIPRDIESAKLRDLEFKRAREAYLASKPWEPFFAARKIINDQVLANETPQNRELRLNRERVPPKASAEVFVWEWSIEEDMCLVRTRVPKKERTDQIEDQKESQARYDSVQNEWDLCEYFAAPRETGYGFVGDDDSDDDGDFGPDFEDHPSTSQSYDDSSDSQQNRAEEFVARRVKVHAGVVPLPAPLLSDDENGLNLIPSQVVDIVAYLSAHYGYRPPIALPPNPSIPDKARWNDLVKTVGLRAKDSNPPPVNFGLSCFDFLQGLQMTNGPPPLIYDLKPHCPIALDVAALRLLFEKVGDLFFLRGSRLKLEPQAPWTIALTTARDAVKVFRLLANPGKHSSVSLAHYLLEMGMTFFTLLPLQCQPSIQLQAHRNVVPIRAPGYVFEKRDYDIYIQHRRRLLSSSRGRAALLAGGLLSRLAREHIGIDSACFGPSPAVTEHHLGCHFTADDGTVYWDDMLTEEEMDVICGFHMCYTGLLFIF